MDELWFAVVFENNSIACVKYLNTACTNTQKQLSTIFSLFSAERIEQTR